MKLKNLFAMTTIALSLIACSSNEPSDPAMEAAKAVANNYDGTFKMYVMNNNVGESAMTVQIKDQKDGKVSLEIPETGSGSMVMSAFSLTDVLVTQNGENYTLSKADTSLVAGNTNLKIQDFTGTVSGSNAQFKMSVTPGSMPMAITCEFTTAQ